MLINDNLKINLSIKHTLKETKFLINYSFLNLRTYFSWYFIQMVWMVFLLTINKWLTKWIRDVFAEIFGQTSIQTDTTCHFWGAKWYAASVMYHRVRCVKRFVSNGHVKSRNFIFVIFWLIYHKILGFATISGSNKRRYCHFSQNFCSDARRLKKRLTKAKL